MLLDEWLIAFHEIFIQKAHRIEKEIRKTILNTLSRQCYNAYFISIHFWWASIIDLTDKLMNFSYNSI